MSPLRMLYEYSLKKIKMESEEIEVNGCIIEEILRASDFKRRIEKLSIFN